MKTNIGEAILILGSIYFILNFRMRWWGTLGLLILVGFALATWEFVHHPKELKELVKAQIEEIRTRTNMMKVQAKLFVAQTVYWMKKEAQ
ncbi:MAG: hypothetical protein QQN41_00170 [Nitrosopumilus sp.]